MLFTSNSIDKITISYWNSHNNKKDKHDICIKSGKILFFLPWYVVLLILHIPAFLLPFSSSRSPFSIETHTTIKKKSMVFALKMGKFTYFYSATADIPAFLGPYSSLAEAEMESKSRTEVFTVTCDEREVFALPVITWTMHTAVY